MFDSRIRPIIDPISSSIASGLVRLGVSANTITLVGFVFGIAAFIAVSCSAYSLAFCLILLNRIFDGLDGAVARHTTQTDLGGYLDIVLDFIFYALIPLGFAIAMPHNAIPAAVLIVSFVGTGSSFLAFAIFAEKRNISTDIRGKKSLYYLGGLTEGTETIVVLCAMCIWPEHFASIAYIFATLCLVTTVTRISWAYITFR